MRLESFVPPSQLNIPSTPLKSSPSSEETVLPWTPAKVYPFCRLPTGGIGVKWTPTAKEKYSSRIVVYQIKNTLHSTRYIGQTSDFIKRMSSHSSAAYCEYDSPLSLELNARPSDFVVGATETKDPDMFEKALIRLKKTIANGYNRRNGGGGGKARKRVVIDQTVVKEALKKFTESYKSPAKYPLKKSRSRIQHTLPKNLLRKKNVIYCIQKRSRIGKVSRYIGCTERKIVHRIQEHLSAANHYQSRRNRNNRLYKKMNKFPEQCFISVIKCQGFLKKLPVQVQEEIVIQFYKNQKGCILFNKNRGGGGGSKK